MRKDKIYWKKQIIGFLLNGRRDNFDLYGEWLPIQSKILDSFIEEIERDDDNVYVCVGDDSQGVIGNVGDVPDSQISIQCRGAYKDINTVEDTKEFYNNLHY